MRKGRMMQKYQLICFAWVLAVAAVSLSSAIAQENTPASEENFFLPGTGLAKDIGESDIIVEATVKRLQKKPDLKNPPWSVHATVEATVSLKGTLTAQFEFRYMQFNQGLDVWDSQLENGAKFLTVAEGAKILLLLKIEGNQATVSRIYPSDYTQGVSAILSTMSQRPSRDRDASLLKAIYDKEQPEVFRDYVAINFIALASDKNVAIKQLVELLENKKLNGAMRWQLAGVAIHQALDGHLPDDLKVTLWDKTLAVFKDSNDPELIRDLLEFYLAVSRKLPIYGEMATALKQAIDAKRSESPKIFEQEIGGWKLNKMAEALIRRLR
jgi:hypothetical protein